MDALRWNRQWLSAAMHGLCLYHDGSFPECTNATAVLVAAQVKTGALWKKKPAGVSEEEYYSTLEQVYFAALEESEMDAAENLLKTLQQKFGADGKRIRQLIALRHEALGEYEQAMQIYRQLLDEDPANAFPVKRQVVIYCAQGKKTDAVKALNRHLETFMADTEAWEQLMLLYAEDKQWEQAAYCAEELLLLRPLLFGYHLQYADILFQLGSAKPDTTADSNNANNKPQNLENVALAFKTYCKVLELADNNGAAKEGVRKCLDILEPALATDAKFAKNCGLNVETLRDIRGILE